MSKEDLYTATYTERFPRTYQVGELRCVMPDVPDEKDMFNYGLKVKDQKYRRFELPKTKRLKRSEADRLAELYWHRRLNGEWWLIKGEPYYIPGPATVFFDFWTKKTGGQPDFREEALEFFYAWYQYVERDPDVFGLYDMKTRRLGDTEKALFIVWERTTRYKFVRSGLQSYTDDEAQKNFQRLAQGNRHMPYFFKPRHSGADNNHLAFMKPSELMTHKKLREESGDIDLSQDGNEFLNSYIDYESTVTGKYDGDQLWTWYLDEIFKIKPHQMDVKAQFNNIRRVQSLHNEELIYGKSILTSTVEKLEARNDDLADTLEVAQYFYDNSNPNDRNELNRTTTGLVRVFRNYELAAKTDEYGFHLREKARAFRKKKLADLHKKGDFKGIIDTRRKEPDTVDDALTQASEKCPLFPELCSSRLNQLQNGLDRWGDPIADYVKPYRVGDLEWKGGQPFTEVVFIDNPNGDFHISQPPIRPNNVKKRRMQVYDSSMGKDVMKNVFIPGNMPYYRCGIDPYDADQIIGAGSRGGAAVKRRLFIPHEKKKLKIDAHGEVENVEDMITNQFVADYLARKNNPYDAYMDFLKLMWWYGVAGFIELDKPGLTVWLRDVGCHGFIQYEPAAAIEGLNRKKSRQGAKTTNMYVSMYVGALKQYISKYIWTCNHPRIVRQWMNFVTEKRTKFDLAVASGWTELADLENNYRPEEEEQDDSWSTSIYQSV